MTPDLDAIRQRLAKATAGPWRHWELDRTNEVQAFGVRCPIVPWAAFDDCDRKLSEHRANANLIAHAPTDLADLLALVDQQQARIAALEAALRSLSNEAHGALTFGEHGIRAEIGHTNFTCLRQRVDEALDVLAALASEEPTTADIVTKLTI